MSLKPLFAATIAASVLLLLTVALAIAWRSGEHGVDAFDRLPRQVEAPPATGRCGIFHARFGGSRAELVKVMMGGVSNYVVLDVGKRDPLMRRQRSIWLRATYGDGEQTWLGDFSSPEAALDRAASLCPPHLRCWPGDEDCRPSMLTPSQAFLRF
jgi:hypothetical protein